MKGRSTMEKVLKNKGEKGITLIALIVMIIVIVIIAAIGIKILVRK